MWPSRAVFTIRHGDGTSSYVNHRALAEKYFENMVKSSKAEAISTHSDDVERRADVASAAFAAHSMLNSVKKPPFHFFDDVVWHAQDALPYGVVKSLAKLLRICNDAKHVWPPAEDGGWDDGPSTGCSETDTAPVSSERANDGQTVEVEKTVGVPRTEYVGKVVVTEV